MSDELPTDLRPVADFFGLPNTAVVEKDWHVVKALAAITAADTMPFRLIFGGGTALSRAHRLIRRMSEDIDLKIVGDVEPTRPALRRLRDTITEVLLAAGFRFDPANRVHRDSRNASRYTIYRLPYEPITAGELAAGNSNRDGRLTPATPGDRVARIIARRRGLQPAARGAKHRLRVDHANGVREIRGPDTPHGGGDCQGRRPA